MYLICFTTYNKLAMYATKKRTLTAAAFLVTLTDTSILGRSGTLYVAMVTKLLSSNCRAHSVESYCKESNKKKKHFCYKLAETLTNSFLGYIG